MSFSTYVKVYNSKISAVLYVPKGREQKKLDAHLRILNTLLFI